MTGPDRIWAWPWEVNPQIGQWTAERQIIGEGTEYIRRDPAVLAALPEVQALIAEAVAKERARIIAALREEADVLPCCEDAKVTEGCADLIEADFAYDEAERIAAIRKRGEGQP